MDSICAFIIGATPEETVVKFFVFAIILVCIFDLVRELVGGVK